MRKLQIITALLIAVVLISFSCTPKPPAPLTATPASTEWDRIVEAAKKEGVLTVYQALGPDVGTAVREEFQKAYGIKVEILGLRGTESRERIRMEQQAEAYICDLILSGWAEPMWMMEKGFAQKVEVELPAAEEKDVWRTHPYQYDPEKRVSLFRNVLTSDVLINTERVKPGEITSWHDLLGPKWKGRMVMHDPRIPGPGLGLYNLIALGEDFWSKLAQQDIVLERMAGRVIDMAALGEKDLAIFPSTLQAVVAIKAGAPVKIIHMKEGTSTILFGASLIKNGPHHNAALVLLNWVIDKEGQIAIGKASGAITIRKDIVEDWVLPELRFDTPSKLLEPLGTDPLYGEKAMAFATQIFGKL